MEVPDGSRDDRAPAMGASAHAICSADDRDDRCALGALSLAGLDDPASAVYLCVPEHAGTAHDGARTRVPAYSVARRTAVCRVDERTRWIRGRARGVWRIRRLCVVERVAAARVALDGVFDAVTARVGRCGAGPARESVRCRAFGLGVGLADMAASGDRGVVAGSSD